MILVASKLKIFFIPKDSLPVVPEHYSFSIIEIPFAAGAVSEQKVFDFLVSLKQDVEKNGVSFDSLAIIHSHDPGTSSQGGYIGFTTRGTLLQEFEEAAYALSIGKISNPIKTSFGYHIIRLIDRQGEKISTQHILQTIDFSEEDKSLVVDTFSNILLLINEESSVFDSLANSYFSRFNNSSGIYNNSSIINISDIFLNKLIGHNKFPVLIDPFETDRGMALIYLYGHMNESRPNLENSWYTIYQYAKQHKQNEYFNNLVENIRKKTHIKIFQY